MNVLFDGVVQDGSVPYWFFTNDRFLNFDFKPDERISYKDRNLRFAGNTSDAIAIVHQGEDRCLQVLDAPYADEPFYATNQEQLVAVSNVSRILPESGSPPPSADVFGPEPPHTWCYYFEKADLARQLQDWDAVLRLDAQAGAAGYAPRLWAGVHSVYRGLRPAWKLAPGTRAQSVGGRKHRRDESAALLNLATARRSCRPPTRPSCSKPGQAFACPAP